MSKYILLLLAIFIPLRPVFAAEPKGTPGQILQVTPIIIDTTLVPGRSQTYTVRVENLLNESLGIHTTIEGLTAEDEENGISITESREKNPLLSWITLKTSDITMDPHAAKDISFTIKTPQKAKKGGYYALVFLTPSYSLPPSTASPVVLSKIGVLVLSHIGKIDYTNLKQKVQIETFRPEHFTTENEPVPFRLRVTNKYFTHFSAKPIITIKPLFGTETRYLLRDKRVLPGKTRAWLPELPIKQLNHFFYRAELTLAVGNGEDVHAGTWFILFPFKKVLLLGITLLILFFILTKRKRIKKALSILIRP